MDPTTFNRFRQIVYDNSGISLNPGKEALVSARVSKRMRALGLADYRDYLAYVTQDPHNEEIVQLLDAISTNVTSFFREPEHFDFVKTVVSGWLANGQQRFRFWSAACSTGEEPYTLAIALREIPETQGRDIKILATDISTRVLAQCRQAVYTKDKLKPVAPALRERYFIRANEPLSESFAVKESLKSMVVFKRLNLATPPFPMQGPLDIVFCRNVMIYFDNGVRRRLLEEAYRLLKPGGYLIVGHAESLTGMVSNFKPVRPSIYTKK